MKFPKSISCQLDEVESVISGWPKKASLDEVMRWILQFDSEDYDIALRVIRNLNVVGFEDQSSALQVAYSKLMRKAIEKDAKITNRNTLFAGIGDVGKSGSMMSYHFRLINENISEENFLDEESPKYLEQGLVENIVLVDDVISTGQQATDEIRKLTEKVTPLGVKNIFVLAVCGMREGIQKVEDETKAYTFSAFEYDRSDTVLSLDSTFYDGIPFDNRESVQKKLADYGSICYKRNPLGYRGGGGLIVFYYNTPNTTLPIIWSDINGWIPLFKRIPRINGIAAYYSQFDIALDERKKASTVKDEAQVDEQAKELSIFVGGKNDELFFDLLAKNVDLAGLIGFKTVNVIAIGGAAVSEKLLLMLAEQKKPALFIFDEDHSFHFQRMVMSPIRNKVRFLFLRPSIISFFDLSEILNSEAAKLLIPQLAEIESLDTVKPENLEALLFRRSRRHVERILKMLIPDFLNQDKILEFAESAREVLSQELENIDNTPVTQN